MKSIWTQDDDALIRRRFPLGNLRRIATDLGCSEDELRSRAVCLGLPIRRRVSPPVAAIADQSAKLPDISSDSARWLAGIIDARGCLSITREPRGNCVGRPRLQFEEISQKLTKEIQSAIGAGHVRKNAEQLHGYDLSTWSELVHLLRIIQPFCRVRQELIAAFLEWDDVAYFPVGIKNTSPAHRKKIKIREKITRRVEAIIAKQSRKSGK